MPFVNSLVTYARTAEKSNRMSAHVQALKGLVRDAFFAGMSIKYFGFECISVDICVCES